MDTPPEAKNPISPTELTSKDIVGLKYFDQLIPLVKRLHDDGFNHDKAGNRELHFDQYAELVLLDLFNPICSSLRAVQQSSELPNVQSRLGYGRAALGSVSEASTIFDPERLSEIIQELGGHLQPLVKDPRLTDIQRCTAECRTVVPVHDEEQRNGHGTGPIPMSSLKETQQEVSS